VQQESDIWVERRINTRNILFDPIALLRRRCHIHIDGSEKQKMKYIDCVKYAQEILDEVKTVPNKGKLAIITVGNDSASEAYVKGKMKDCEYCSIPVERIKIEENDFSGIELLWTIRENNADPDVAGIIVQLPLPDGLNAEYYCKEIVPLKDVDGLGSDKYFKPCTPKGIVHLLKKELGDLTGKNVLIIGRSNLVGKPLARMLLDEDCTVTVAHSKTDFSNLNYYTAELFDIVVSAVGKAKAFHLKDFWCAEVFVDVGINRDEDGHLCGDFRGFSETIREHTKVTPVPGGVGLLTRAMLMKNVAEASKMRNGVDVKDGN
jgi:methylenetetrahydrofolate dehydrogenase (NADP+)/methenyltetrahydrofolate cyclohydrolase